MKPRYRRAQTRSTSPVMCCPDSLDEQACQAEGGDWEALRARVGYLETINAERIDGVERAFRWVANEVVAVKASVHSLEEDTAAVVQSLREVVAEQEQRLARLGGGERAAPDLPSDSPVPPTPLPAGRHRMGLPTPERQQHVPEGAGDSKLVQDLRTQLEHLLQSHTEATDMLGKQLSAAQDAITTHSSDLERLSQAIQVVVARQARTPADGESPRPRRWSDIASPASSPQTVRRYSMNSDKQEVPESENSDKRSSTDEATQQSEMQQDLNDLENLVEGLRRLVEVEIEKQRHVLDGYATEEELGLLQQMCVSLSESVPRELAQVEQSVKLYVDERLATFLAHSLTDNVSELDRTTSIKSG